MDLALSNLRWLIFHKTKPNLILLTRWIDFKWCNTTAPNIHKGVTLRDLIYNRYNISQLQDGSKMFRYENFL